MLLTWQLCCPVITLLNIFPVWIRQLMRITLLYFLLEMPRSVDIVNFFNIMLYCFLYTNAPFAFCEGHLYVGFLSDADKIIFLPVFLHTSTLSLQFIFSFEADLVRNKLNVLRYFKKKVSIIKEFKTLLLKVKLPGWNAGQGFKPN